MMQENRQVDVQKYRSRRQKRKTWRNFVRIMACIVVFCTTYALILPAITLEKEAFCGIEAHVHEAACYAEGTAIACTAVEDTDTLVIHSHDALCYDGETLICQLPELAGHVHTDTCYETVTLEAHAHSEACYTPQRGALLCALAEEEGHAHGEGCYSPGEALLCTETERPGHTHGEGCYTVSTELTCTEQEGTGHAHEEGCYDDCGNRMCTEE